VYVTGPEVSVSVPLGGVAAKLNSVRNKPALTRVDATKTRGLKIPVSDVDFFFMTHGSGFWLAITEVE